MFIQRDSEGTFLSSPVRNVRRRCRASLCSSTCLLKKDILKALLKGNELSFTVHQIAFVSPELVSAKNIQEQAPLLTMQIWGEKEAVKLNTKGMVLTNNSREVPLP